MEGANRSVNPKDVVESLNVGLSALDPGMLPKIQMIVPDGKYYVLLMRMVPPSCALGRRRTTSVVSKLSCGA